METLHAGGREKVGRIAKYLNGELPRNVQVFPVGSDDGAIHAYSNSDWAACLQTWQIH